MKKLVFVVLLFGISVFAFACGGSSAGNGNPAATGKVVGKATAGNLTVNLATESGVLKSGANDFTLSFTDASGKPVDVGAASVNFFMPAMGSMAAMNDAATLTTSATAGVYNGKVKLSMGGEWQVQIAFEGAAGKGKTSFPITAQ